MTAPPDAPLSLPSFRVCHDRWGFDWSHDDTQDRPSGFVVRQDGLIRLKKLIAQYPATADG